MNILKETRGIPIESRPFGLISPETKHRKIRPSPMDWEEGSSPTSSLSGLFASEVSAG